MWLRLKDVLVVPKARSIAANQPRLRASFQAGSQFPGVAPHTMHALYFAAAFIPLNARGSGLAAETYTIEYEVPEIEAPEDADDAENENENTREYANVLRQNIRMLDGAANIEGEFQPGTEGEFKRRSKRSLPNR